MKESINLLSQTPDSGKPLIVVPDRLASLVTIATLIIEVFFVFLLLARIGYDRELLLLRGLIEIKKSALTQTAEVERTIRNVQDKLSTIRDLRQNRFSYFKALDYVPILVPEDVTILDVEISQDYLLIVAQTASGSSFAKMVENVSRSARFSDLTLTGSSFDDQKELYTFNFEAAVGKGVFKE